MFVCDRRRLYLRFNVSYENYILWKLLNFGPSIYRYKSTDQNVATFLDISATKCILGTLTFVMPQMLSISEGEHKHWLTLH